MALVGYVRLRPQDGSMTDLQIRPDLYVSADVETDGPVPGPFSLLSFGLTVVGKYDGTHFERFELGKCNFYRELRPISDQFEEEALAVNGLDRERLKEEGVDPRSAMSEAADWIRSLSNGHRPILVAYPVAFDWSFLYWYFESFAADGSPFGHSSCLDIRTLYQAIAGTVFDRSGKGAMPDFLQPRLPHTHNALEDAVEQGELFANLLGWAISRRPTEDRQGEDASEPSWLAHHILPIA
jgi:DNA polymerase III epsilon subunit-like protein